MTNLIYTLRRTGAIPPTIQGDEIARKRLSKAERARIAAAMMDRTTKPENLNQRQIATLCGVSIGYAIKQRRKDSSAAPVIVQLAAE
jgi:hypothetical protein